MKRLFFILAAAVAVSCGGKTAALKRDFKDPPNEYRPMPFWHLNGHLTKEGVEERITNAHMIDGFGGVTVLPVSPGPQYPTGLTCPGMTPQYLSDEYFERYGDMLAVSEKLGTQLVLYDDIDFPSGSAGGRLKREFPQYTRKMLVKDEFITQGGRRVDWSYDAADTTSALMAVSAMNTSTLEVVDLAPYLKDGTLSWNAPAGQWRIMAFRCKYYLATEGNYSSLVDYMQPEAVEKFISMTYDEYDKRFSGYFGNVVTKTFFDDVGFVHSEETWNPEITEIFKKKTGRNPALYYPALYYDIGPESQAARVAFFDARSELMAEGYVKQVSQWSEARNMRSMGHPPENYSPNTVVANGDILKYYRHVHIPLLDAIFRYGRGLNGFKQISSAADLGDKPLVGAELCGAFPADMDSLTLNRVVLEAMVRGVNFVVPHGMWYDTNPRNVRIPPLISNENPLLRDALPAYSAMTGRSCLLLQGGRRVSDIALLWPITAVQGGTTINRDAASGKEVATWLPDNVNNYELSAILTNELRRDFTYIHPEDLLNGKVTANGAELSLNNEVNIQNYKALIMPGGDVISADALRAIKAYYDNGGKVIATASLPSKSAEFGCDDEVRGIIESVFGQTESAGPLFADNGNGGTFAFLPRYDRVALAGALDRMEITPDVAFDEASIPPHEIGYVNYIHKQRDGLDIYFLTNTTDRPLNTTVALRGEHKKLELWDPHTGTVCKVSGKQDSGAGTTGVYIELPPVSSVFIVGESLK